MRHSTFLAFDATFVGFGFTTTLEICGLVVVFAGLIVDFVAGLLATGFCWGLVCVLLAEVCVVEFVFVDGFAAVFAGLIVD